MIKKTFSTFLLIIILFLTIPFLQGCGEDKDELDGFRAVYKVEYTTNGEKKEEKSSKRFIYSYEISITKEEYNSVPKEYTRYYAENNNPYENVFCSYKEAEPKGKIEYIVGRKNLNEYDSFGFDKNYFTYYWGGMFNPDAYRKKKLDRLVYTYVYVKKINDTIKEKSDTEIKKSVVDFINNKFKCMTVAELVNNLTGNGENSGKYIKFIYKILRRNINKSSAFL